jgi:enamine deaminase RidA (YjgF/YER057c/UK114 family)
MSTIVLPDAPSPIGAYLRGTLHHGIGMLSGQFPLVAGKIARPGRLGAELTVEQGREAARMAALNALAQIRALLDGFDALEGILRLDGIIASVDVFRDHPAVLDGASEVFNDFLGPRGRHARTIVPVRCLPLDAPIELVVTFACRPGSGAMEPPA